MIDTQLNEAQQLRALANKLSIRQLAELVGVSQTTYWHWLKGRSIPEERASSMQTLLATTDFTTLCWREGEARLSSRERQVLCLVAHCYTNEEIAQRICIQSACVAMHMTHLLTKTKLSHRTELIIYALKTGIISLDEIELRYIEKETTKP